MATATAEAVDMNSSSLPPMPSLDDPNNDTAIADMIHNHSNGNNNNDDGDDIMAAPKTNKSLHKNVTNDDNLPTNNNEQTSASPQCTHQVVKGGVCMEHDAPGQ
ncbi:hypothetical protein QTG54_015935 [Skeletonema marinoi]|uniref:Uncharacterized protein n=1 Tax=Skeletonema marinoi TaxID=267567 RepID=A0AAD9D490_9STRA|nr:hypothetical protein QTG54_015935 [Skeletonema marinoi]